jgi:hypothetical protein
MLKRIYIYTYVYMHYIALQDPPAPILFFLESSDAHPADCDAEYTEYKEARSKAVKAVLRSLFRKTEGKL